MKCGCVDVRVGSYDNQVTLRVGDTIDPRCNTLNIEPGEYVSLDVCIADEVAELWAKGIITTGCCCGHNRTIGYIGVAEAHISKMKALGYRVILNPQYPDDKSHFVPKYTAEEGG